MKKTQKVPGFTLVEIMIVVAIIGLIAAIAIPSFIKARQSAFEQTTRANLKRLSETKTIWALDTDANETTTPAWSMLSPNYIRKKPIGPGSYYLNAVNTEPTSSLGYTL